MSEHEPAESRARDRALRADLDALVASSAAVLRRARARDGVLDDLGRAALLLPIVPAVLFVARLVTGEGLGGWEMLLALVLTPLPALVYLGTRALWRFARPISRAEALGTLDRFLGLKERLVAADEFLSHERSSAWTEAALEDAGRFAHSGLGASLYIPPPPFRMRGRLRLCAALALLGLALSLGGAPEHAAQIDDTELARAPLDAPALEAVARRETPTPEPPPELTEPPTGAPRDRAPAEAAGTRVADESTLPDRAKKSEGKTGDGRSSNARSSQGESDALGDPTKEAQTSKEEAAPTKPDKKPKKPKPHAKPDDAKRKPVSEESGATAGRGAASGSNKNPAATDWKSRDHVDTSEEEPLEDDAEVDDETEESESRGGIQPNLRDRRPPVSRDLQIGFGNRPNPDANGRGGPSAQKKSRGVASLVLGVPIPDRIKGRPNAGRTKITQERVEPREESSTAETAGARAARESPADPFTAPELAPWMRALVRSYFIELHGGADPRAAGPSDGGHGDTHDGAP